jgi:hypothetical protein
MGDTTPKSNTPTPTLTPQDQSTPLTCSEALGLFSKVFESQLNEREVKAESFNDKSDKYIYADEKFPEYIIQTINDPEKLKKYFQDAKEKQNLVASNMKKLTPDEQSKIKEVTANDALTSKYRQRYGIELQEATEELNTATASLADATTNLEEIKSKIEKEKEKSEATVPKSETTPAETTTQKSEATPAEATPAEATPAISPEDQAKLSEAAENVKAKQEAKELAELQRSRIISLIAWQSIEELAYDHAIFQPDPEVKKHSWPGIEIVNPEKKTSEDPKDSLSNLLSNLDKLSEQEKTSLITQLLDVDSALTFLEKVEKDRGLEEEEAARAWDIGLGWFNRDIEREEKEIFK